MKNRVKTLLCALAFSATSAYAEPKLIDSIAAIVDNQIILESTLNERMEVIAARAKGSNTALPELAALREQVLEHLIIEQLQVQMASRYGVTIDDAEINAVVNNMMQENQMSEAQFNAQLAMEGMTIDTLKERVRRDMMIQNIQRGLVSQRITVSDLEIDNFLKSAEAQFWLSPEYHLGHILISLPQSASEADIQAAKDKADELYQKASQGSVFAELAIAHSKGPNALKGGDLGFRKTSDLPSLFAQIAPELEVGGVSKPARSAAGFHIIKLYEKRGEASQVVKQTRARHILIKPSAIVTDEQAQAKLTKIRQQILKGADFSEMAKEHSEDIGSMLSGGDLGWSSPGQFVPAFEKTMSETDIGEISEPFRSQFGWHILQVQEQRDEDMTEAVIRNKARNILTNRRFEDELQVWLNELRDDAFVEIKTEVQG
ncbi:MAG TPA: peptidylprolyl isomerase [Marinagarivorans sp.]